MLKQSDYLEYQRQLESSKLVRYFWQFWSNYSFVFFVVAVVIMLASTQMRPYFRPVMVLVILSFLVARGIVVTTINIFISRRRPYQDYNFTPITSKFFSYKTSYPNSFPSRHAASYFSVATVICLFFPAMGAALIGVSMLTGLARVVLGFHWPTDILIGAILGVVVGYLTVLLGYSMLFT